LLLAAGRAGCPVIVSTGMATIGEVESALSALAFAMASPHDVRPTPEAMSQAYSSERGQALLRERVTLLHCTTEYPAPASEVNLRAMDTLRAAFCLPVGYSDHTQGIHVSVAAVARGAVVIEKHFTQDRSLPGPDHAASLEPGELAELVGAIRDVESALGSGVKIPSASERKNIAVARKSLVAAIDIRRGEPYTARNLTTKRPGSGICAMRYDEYLGRRADRDYAADDLIQEP
jgi:N-acetylneuraminate synthase